MPNWKNPLSLLPRLRLPKRSTALFTISALLFLALSAALLRLWGSSLNLPHPQPSPQILDRRSDPVAEVLNPDGQRYVPISDSDLSPVLLAGLASLEDRNFYSHFGVSPSAVMRSAYNNAKILLDLSE